MDTKEDIPSTLTPEQRSFLESCEQEFSSRFTDSDRDYKQMNESGPPPIMEPWYSKPRRNYDWANKRNDRYDRGSDRNDRSTNRNCNDRYDRGSDRNDRPTNRNYDAERNRYRRY